MDFDLSDVYVYAQAYDADDNRDQVNAHQEIEKDFELIAEMSEFAVDLDVKELQIELEDFNKLLDKLML